VLLMPPAAPQSSPWVGKDPMGEVTVHGEACVQAGHTAPPPLLHPVARYMAGGRAGVGLAQEAKTQAETKGLQGAGRCGVGCGGGVGPAEGWHQGEFKFTDSNLPNCHRLAHPAPPPFASLSPAGDCRCKRKKALNYMPTLHYMPNPLSCVPLHAHRNHRVPARPPVCHHVLQPPQQQARRAQRARGLRHADRLHCRDRPARAAPPD
jgi:hypothetical protein